MPISTRAPITVPKWPMIASAIPCRRICTCEWSMLGASADVASAMSAISHSAPKEDLDITPGVLSAAETRLSHGPHGLGFLEKRKCRLISGTRRGLTPKLTGDLRRRSVIETEIGHIKTHGRLPRCPLKGTMGDPCLRRPKRLRPQHPQDSGPPPGLVCLVCRRNSDRSIPHGSQTSG